MPGGEFPDFCENAKETQIVQLLGKDSRTLKLCFFSFLQARGESNPRAGASL